MSLPLDPTTNVNVMEALKGSVIRYIPSTGVPVIDMMLMTWVIMSLNNIVTFLRKMLDTLKQYIVSYFSKNLPSVTDDTPKTVELQFRFNLSSENSVQMRAILFRVFKIKKYERGIIFEQTYLNLGYSGKKLYLLKTDDHYVKIDDNIYFRCKSEQNTENAKSYTHDTTIHLQSKTLTLKQLNNWVSESVTMFKQKQKSHEKEEQYFIKMCGVGKTICKLFYTNRNFNNVFFPQKQHFLKCFTNFRTKKEEYYDRLGLPYQFGVLLYGAPGCGKTSFIKALAKETGFDLVSLNLDVITDDEFENLFIKNTIDGYGSSKERRIYVIEDIDCYSATHRRAELSHQLDKSDQDVVVYSDLQPQPLQRGVSLGALLNVIDGAVEYQKIIVMTTNHIEKLDPALIRPGRIDIKIELGPATVDTLKEMFEWFYPDFDLDDVDLTPLDKKHTPAYIVSIFKQYPLDSKLAFETLLSGQE